MYVETSQMARAIAPMAAAGASNIDWVRLVLNVDIVSLRILEKVYLPDPKPYVLGILYREISGVRVSKVTVWRRVQKLAGLGLLKIMEETRPLCVWPVEELSGNVKKLALLARARIFGGAGWEKR
jgi:hypothetical protein